MKWFEWLQINISVNVSPDYLQYYFVHLTNNTFVATVDDEVIGGFIVYELSNTELWLESIIVKENQRRKNYGRKLIEFAEDITKEHGFSQLKFCVSTKNLNGIAFYKHLGYQSLTKEND